MWHARTKNDLMIEVWEKLDCESVGAIEIEAIEIAVGEAFGRSAVDSPMVIARLLADEGADLRHSEIMEIYVGRASDRPYDAALRNILNIDGLRNAETSLRNLENLRRKYLADKDKEGLRLVLETARRGKSTAAEIAGSAKTEALTSLINAEIVQWFTIWLQSPDVFSEWLTLRQSSRDFIDKFGRMS